MSRAIVLLSGGIDSATALAWASRNYEAVVAVSFQYYLRPFRERLAVFRQLLTFPAKLIEVPLPFLKEACDMRLTGFEELPEGYIPNRNMIFYSIAAYHAQAESCDALIGGHNAGDREDFPDAGRDFFDAFQLLANRALLSHQIIVELPLLGMSKKQVIEKAVEWGVRLEDTWSCYWDGAAPCGQCASCKERSEAFAAADICDPLQETHK